MTRLIEKLSEIGGEFDCAVLDQWGVLHNGLTLYPGVVGCLEWLKRAGKRVIVLSNSGKRADLNRVRIEGIGVPAGLIDDVLTSGEVLWNDLFHRRIDEVQGSGLAVFFVAREPGDPNEWVQGLPQVKVSKSIGQADVVTILGTPDGLGESHYDVLLQQARERELLLICANPDKASPRKTGSVLSPGFFADRYAAMGGRTLVYGKPCQAVFQEIKSMVPHLPADRLLMVGDSLEHDIAGAAKAGMKSLFIRGGLLANEFQGLVDVVDVERRIVELSEKHCPGVTPSYTLEFLI